MKRALILGCSGFIGGHLVKYLMDENYYVVGCDIRNINYTIFTPNEFILGDLRDINIVNNLLNKYFYDEIYQLSADMGGAIYINSGNNDGSVMSNSVTINANLLRCAVTNKHNIGKIFFASSACVYPHSIEDIATCKESDAYPAFPDNEYGWEKLYSERMYKSFEKQYGIDIFIARFHSIVGDYSVCFNDRAKAHSALAYKVATVEENGIIDVIGDGTQIRTFLYVKDCIKGIKKIMDTNCKEILNIGSDHCISINEYINILKNISGKNFNINYINGPTGVKFRYCDIQNIKNICGWYPETTIEESTKKTYEFILQEIKNKSL